MAFPRKVGVLTFHRCINYGSYWQARCLVEGLRQRGHDAVLLDHDSPQATRAEWRCALSPLLPTPTPGCEMPRYAAKTRKFLRAFEGLPRSRRFSLESPEDIEPCDVAVLGSDEIWNLRHPWYAGYPLFFGEGLKAARVVSYAASFGNHSREEGLGESWIESLRRFAAISVRDENSRELIEHSLGAEPPMVLDPCLQFDAGQAPTAVEAEDYALVYGHTFPPAIQGAVRRWAKARGLRLVSLGYHNDWADEQRIDVGPEEFPTVVAKAQAVVTNFFHGCVFAILNMKPFVCAVSGYRQNKVRSLTDSLGISRRLVAGEAPADGAGELLNTPLDLRILDRLAAMRTASNAYLDHALA